MLDSKTKNPRKSTVKSDLLQVEQRLQKVQSYIDEIDSTIAEKKQ